MGTCVDVRLYIVVSAVQPALRVVSSEYDPDRSLLRVPQQRDVHLQ